jgi:hypothetical protein
MKRPAFFGQSAQPRTQSDMAEIEGGTSLPSVPSAMTVFDFQSD